MCDKVSRKTLSRNFYGNAVHHPGCVQRSHLTERFGGEVSYHGTHLVSHAWHRAFIARPSGPP